MTLDWILLISALVFLAYGAWSIRREKDVYEENAKDIEFHGTFLKVPHWWGLVEKQPNRLLFERTDTHYDWKAIFEWQTDTEDGPRELLDKKLEQMKVEFDPDADAKTNDNFARREGWATEDFDERIHLDMAVFKQRNGTLTAFSKSSPLNGCVEGPYFEEVLKGIRS